MVISTAWDTTPDKVTLKGKKKKRKTSPKKKTARRSPRRKK